MSGAWRIEDTLRQLCIRVAVATDGDELRKAIADLSAAVDEYRLRGVKKTPDNVLPWPVFPRERRKP